MTPGLCFGHAGVMCPGGWPQRPGQLECGECARMGAPGRRSSKTSGRDTHQAVDVFATWSTPPPTLSGPWTACVPSHRKPGGGGPPRTPQQPSSIRPGPARLGSPCVAPDQLGGAVSSSSINSLARVWPWADSPLRATVEFVSHALR